VTHVPALVHCAVCRTEYDSRTFLDCPVCASNAAKREKLDAVLPITPLTTEPS
jgi:hypothetical protein